VSTINAEQYLHTAAGELGDPTLSLSLDDVLALFPGTSIVEPDDPDVVWGWRTCNVDMTSRDGWRWPYPGNWCEQDGPADGEACGQGLHVARTIRGATSAGYRRTVQIVAYSPSDVLGWDDDKVRVRRAWVAGLADLHALAKPGANLWGANLRDANLRDANLRDADLGGAYGDADTRLPDGWHVDTTGVIQWEADRG
jgi:hypothetical protein